MFEILKPCVRSATVAGTALTLLGATALPLQANAQAAAAMPARVDATAAQVVVRDAATGALRTATPEEAQALNPGPRAEFRRSAAPSTMPKVHYSGARGARLHDEFMSYSVVVRRADGSLAEQCFSSKDEADAAIRSTPVAKAVTLPTE